MNKYDKCINKCYKYLHHNILYAIDICMSININNNNKC